MCENLASKITTELPIPELEPDEPKQGPVEPKQELEEPTQEPKREPESDSDSSTSEPASPNLNMVRQLASGSDSAAPYQTLGSADTRGNVWGKGYEYC